MNIDRLIEMQLELRERSLYYLQSAPLSRQLIRSCVRRDLMGQPWKISHNQTVQNPDTRPQKNDLIVGVKINESQGGKLIWVSFKGEGKFDYSVLDEVDNWGNLLDLLRFSQKIDQATQLQEWNAALEELECR